MDRSRSDDQGADIAPPKRSLSTEFFVGLFTLIGLACAGWLAVGLGGVSLFRSNTYILYAEFDNISGLKPGASVEIAGVPVGHVAGIELKDPSARVRMEVNNDVQIRDDDVASIRTKGIIGDRYIKISRGASDEFIPEEGTVMETESVVDIEDLIGKFVHSMGNDNDEERAGNRNSKKL